MASSGDSLGLAMAVLDPGPDVESRVLLQTLRRRMFRRESALRLGRYEQLTPVGAGGVGLVYRGRDPVLQRDVAIKVLRPAGPSQMRILEEARMLARLSHPNIVEVLDVGTYEGEVFVAMEFVRGRTVYQRLRGRAPSRDEVVSWCLDAAAGLEYAHRHGVVHYDIKPSNIMVGADGRVRLLDFGLARWGEEAAAGLGGTPSYAPPEQRDGCADARADQFSLTAVLYEALTGRRAAGRCVVQPKDGLSPRMRRFLARGLSPQPQGRFDSMRAWSRALRRANRSRAPLLLAGFGVAATLWWGMTLAQPGSASPCGVGEQWWSEHDRQLARQRLATAQPGFAAEAFSTFDRALTSAQEEWSAAFLVACQANDVRRRTCLERQVPAFEVTASWVQQALIDDLARAEDVLGALPSPIACADLPRDAAEDQDLVAAQSVARVQVEQGDYAGALATLDALDASAVARARSPTAGLFEDTAAIASMRTGAFERAAEHFERAYLHYLDAGKDGAAARSAARLAYLLAMELAAPADARRWIAHSVAASSRAPSQDEAVGAQVALAMAELTLGESSGALERLEHLNDEADPRGPLYAELQSARASALYQAARVAEAGDAQRRAIEAHRRRYGTRHPKLIGPLNNLAILLEESGDQDGAWETLEGALGAAERTLGPHHVQTAETRGNLGSMALARGRSGQARQLFERAVDDLERGYDPGHPSLISPLQGLADALLQEGRHEEAERTITRAFAIARGIGSVEPRWRVGLHATHGAILAAAGRVDEAVDAYEAAIEILEPLLGPGHPAVAQLREDAAAVASGSRAARVPGGER